MSDSQVFFRAVTKPRNCRKNQDIPRAVDHIDLILAVWGDEQKIRRSGHAYRASASGRRQGQRESDRRRKTLLPSLTILQLLE